MARLSFSATSSFGSASPSGGRAMAFPSLTTALANGLQPVAQRQCRDAVVLVVALHDRSHFRGHVGVAVGFQQPFHLMAIVVRVRQLHFALEAVEGLQILDRVLLHAGSQRTPNDRVQIHEQAAAQHEVEFFAACGVAPHEALQRARFVGREVVDVHVPGVADDVPSRHRRTARKRLSPEHRSPGARRSGRTPTRRGTRPPHRHFVRPSRTGTRSPDGRRSARLRCRRRRRQATAPATARGRDRPPAAGVRSRAA